MPPPIKTSLSIKTPTYSSIYSRKGICFTATPLTLLPIASTPGAAVAVTTSTSARSVRVYLAMAISVYINIVYK